MIKSKIISVGSYLPEKILTNNDLAKTVNTSDEWIISRVGIKSRHIAKEGEYTSDLATMSLRNALDNNTDIIAKDIDVIIVATSTPDVIFPATAAIVQQKLGLKNCWTLDINVACCGFLSAAQIADSLIISKKAKTIAVIGAETFSRITDWQDRHTCILFGDGAGTAIFQANEIDNSGIVDIALYSDGSLGKILNVSGGISMSNSDAAKIQMNGKEVYRHAIARMYNSVKDLLQKNNYNKADVDWVLPHQANYRIIKSLANKLEIDESKCMITIEYQANTGAATIPLALHKYIEKKAVKKGDLIAMAVAGAGFTWGAGLMIY